MQMTISTTGRRQLCILCSVCVLSKMLKLCGAEGSSFRWLMGTGSCFCEFHPICFWSGSRCWAVFCLLEVHQIDPLWCCCQALADAFSGCWGPSDFLFLRWTLFWSSMLDTVNRLCWGSIGATVRGTIFGCYWMLSVTDLAFWCFHQTHWLLGLVRVVGKECPLLRSFRFVSEVDLIQCWVFWDEACQLVSLQWLEPFDACQWLVVSDRCLIASSFCWDQSSVSEVDLFAVEIYQTFRFWGGSLLLKSVLFWRSAIGTDITVCLSQLSGSWVHWWRRVPFWGGCVSCWDPSDFGFWGGSRYWSITFCLWRCRKNRKPRLDFSSRCLTSLRLACGRISIVEYVRCC